MDTDKLLKNILDRKYYGNYCVSDSRLDELEKAFIKTSDTGSLELLYAARIKRDEFYHSEKVKFLNIKSISDFSPIFGFYRSGYIFELIEYLKNDNYSEFYIPKKKGGFRKISAPNALLMRIQKILSFYLNVVYHPKPSAHGFVFNKSVITNASNHIGKRSVLNVDIKDFFPSVNWGRVRGIFLGYPFSFSEPVSNLLANICCYKNCLPQGSPVSPILTNYICRGLDNNLISLSRKNKLFYSRYADDLTFSSTASFFPDSLFTQIEKIITAEGFVINKEKVRIQSRYVRQEVTGIKVNKKLNIDRRYIRNIRAILFSIKLDGMEKAVNKFRKSYPGYRLAGIPDFKSSVRGHIDFIGNVRGRDDFIYKKLLLQFKELTQ